MSTTKPAIVQLEEAIVYQQDHLVLNKVSMQIEEGEFIYLIGKTGSGKSTLLKALYGEVSLRAGQGTVAGINLRKLTWRRLPRLRRNLGIVFQDFNLLTDRTVGDNLGFVLRATGWKNPKAIRLRIDEVLDNVGLKTKGRKMPHELSGGEQQRIVIARALLNRPKLILADEPTGNLDPETSDEIVLLLRELSQQHQVAVLFATHDYLLLEKFPARIIRCQKGRLTDQENFVV